MDPSFEAAWAIPWTAEEFVTEAVKAGHPRSLHGNLPAPPALNAHMEMSEEEICSKRMMWARRWTHEIVKCEAEEKLLKSQLPPNSRHILRDKRLTVWRSMLEEAGYSDVAIVNDVSNGFQLAGPSSSLRPFEKSLHPRHHDVRAG